MKFSLFIFFLFMVFSSVAQTEENKNYRDFEASLKNGFKYLELRKRDSLEFFVKKTDSILKVNLDSTNYFRYKILEASLDIRKNESDKAISSLLKTQTFFKKKKDTANLALTLYTLGIANYYLNRRPVAITYFEKAYSYKEYISKKLATKLLQNLGSMNLEIGTGNRKDRISYVNKAIKSYQQVLKIYQQENWIIDEILATTLLAECYNQLKEYKKATTVINRAISLAKKAKNKNKEGFALIKKASILNKRQNLKEALKTIKKARSIFETLEDLPTLNYALIQEKVILTNLKKYKEAVQISDSIHANIVKIYSNRFADKVSEMETIYKTVEKEKQITLQKEELLSKELKIKNRNLYIILFAAAFLILAIISFFLLKKNQFKKKQLQKEIDLKDALATIKTQNRLQEQRLRISRDLHDNIGSQLTFIISSIDNLKFVTKDANTKLKDKLSGISTFTSETIHQLRDTIWAMNKNEITVEDLHTRILSFVEKAKNATENIEFIVNYNIDKNQAFSSLEGMNIFRVIQEAINNAIKYAKATKIEIKIDKKENQFVIKVVDNGIGFDINSVELGNGLSNMEKRMSEIGGRVKIISKVRIGTEISMEIFLKKYGK
ncbi:hypothetical protein JL193_11165 [Polaribacter batillariae]|uniref:histidine kinase n=1 Tax=Polaribacter batillariae TaxID=2808900 RepID=A0ABX7STB3_9FLAO|nr:ATP-binding protein [Polaribacter batillariae]QTD36698.1 hypothetical protein JL193_11165 [Polaribacter batillariae]